jgi:hypothetical protein
MNYAASGKMPRSPLFCQLSIENFHALPQANVHVASKVIPRLLQNQEFHYRVHKSVPGYSILSQTNLVHILKPLVFNIRLNNILPCSLKF